MNLIPTAAVARVPIVEELADAPDPWDTARRLADLPHLLFLDSADRHPDRGRYSFVTADPAEWIVDYIDRPRWLNPFAALKARLGEFPLRRIPDLPPFQGGLAGMFGYGLQHVLERLPRPRFDEFGCPDLAAGIYDWTIAWDHGQKRCWIVSTGFPLKGRRRRERAAKRLQWIRRLLDRASPSLPPWPSSLPPTPLCPQYPLPDQPDVTSNFSREGYLRAVQRAIAYIHAGDSFQINLSQRLLAPLRDHPLVLYERLRQRNPAPFAAFLDLGPWAIASASPERFLRVVDGAVETRPIKGTRRRLTDPAGDRQQAEQLAASPKDRAENVMIVDLLRNDLGRVCAFGSIRVPRVCEVESFRYVHHLVSEVRGQLRPDQTAIDLLRACFPGGSVTGAPKVRAMEIIAELEPTARGPYCGSIGYIGFDGSMDTNILIRTCTIGRGYVQFPVGGGIVADSDPDEEYRETLDKARGLIPVVSGCER